MADINLHNLRAVSARAWHVNTTTWIELRFRDRLGRETDDHLVLFLEDEAYANALADTINFAGLKATKGDTECSE